MQQTVSNSHLQRRPRLTIRIGRKSMSFAVASAAADNQLLFEPYTVKSGISMAANLREAFRTSDMLAQGYDRVMVMIDTPALMIPIEEFDEEHCEELYWHAFTRQSNDVVMHNVLLGLNAVAVFAVNKDLKLVIDDHFSDVKMMVASSSVWNHLYQRSFTGNRRKLYGYFHDKQLDITCYEKSRFKFCNTYEVDRYMDAVYFLLYVWKQLGFDAKKDELHLCGSIIERDSLLAELRKYVQNVYVINPSADFNRAPITQIKGLPYDVMTYYVKGR